MTKVEAAWVRRFEARDAAVKTAVRALVPAMVVLTRGGDCEGESGSGESGDGEGSVDRGRGDGSVDGGGSVGERG